MSTTVDEQLLASARHLRWGRPDSALMDEALGALLAHHRAAELDAPYSAYDEHPLDEADEWGGLASFREGAAVATCFGCAVHDDHQGIGQRSSARPRRGSDTETLYGESRLGR